MRSRVSGGSAGPASGVFAVVPEVVSVEFVGHFFLQKSNVGDAGFAAKRADGGNDHAIIAAGDAVALGMGLLPGGGKGS
jgi:hypothetical protein